MDQSRIKHISSCQKTEKPWGYEILWAQTEDYVAKIMFITPNNRMSLQFHEKKEETLYVMSGKLKVWESENDDEYAIYESGCVYHVKPGNIHRFGATEKEPTMLIEVSTPELDDVVRIKDDYRR